MSERPLHYRTVRELATGLEQGEHSALELTEHFLARIDELDPILGAYRLVTPELAREQARAADALRARGETPSPLCGIPYAAKDLFDVAGLPTSAGSRLLEHANAPVSSRVVQMLEAAGMVLLGKTNTVQFAYGGVGLNNDHGTPRNPWHREHHVPGGSSSGSGVAVAAGMAPMGLGTDTGGSVRVPAAFCGVTGLKTTVGRVSRRGVYPLSWTLDSVGPLTRSVEDAALVFDAIQGPDPGDEPTLAREPSIATPRLRARPVRGLRVGIAEEVFWRDAHPEVEQAVRDCAKVFSALGASVRSIELPEVDAAYELNASGLVIVAEAYASNRRFADEHFEELDPVVAHRIIKGRGVDATDYLATLGRRDQLRTQAFERLAEVDVFLAPTTPITAFPLARVKDDLTAYAKYNLLCLRNTAIGNVLNLCGLSVPCGATTEGLPVGLMIYAKPFDEALVLRAGFAFQQATNWHMQTPQPVLDQMVVSAPA